MRTLICFLLVIYYTCSNVCYVFWHSDFNNDGNGWTTSGTSTAWRTTSTLCPIDKDNCCCVLINPLGYYSHVETATYGYKNITLSFDFNGQQLAQYSGDYCTVFYSFDYGQTHHELWKFTGSLWSIENKKLFLPSHENLIVGFYNYATVNAGYNYCFFDNIALTGVEPTTNPTKLPTFVPSKSPTYTPSESPSNYPSKSPSKNPSKSPTYDPTETPTKILTHSPTYNPTNTPTDIARNPPSTTTETDIFVIIVAVDNLNKLDTDEITNVVTNVLTVYANDSNIHIDIISNDKNKHSVSILFAVTKSQLQTDILKTKVRNRLHEEYDDIDFDVSVKETVDHIEESRETEINDNTQVTDVMLEIVIVVMVLLCIICVILIFVARKQIKKHRKVNAIVNNTSKFKKKIGVSNTINLESNSIEVD